MSTPLKGFRPVAETNNGQSAQVRKTTPYGPFSLISQYLKPSKQLISSISFSTAVHAIILFALSLIYFDLPHQFVFESILSLAGNDAQPAGGNVEIDFRGATETTIDVGEKLNEPIVLHGDLVPIAPENFDSELAQGLDRSQLDRNQTGKGKPFSPKAANGKTATATKLAMISKSASKQGGNTEGAGQHADHFAGRSPMARAAMLKRMGGTDASEAAVARGLVWLKDHQLPDGSWNFYHLLNPRCDCSMPGTMANNPNAATAMAVLSFLGAGQTDKTGEYKIEVEKGLDFLLANATPAEKGVSFYGQLVGPPTYYTHGLVTIALSEAFAMTGDVRLRPAITGAIDYLVATQESGGGWRYFPGQPGDTSVVAWQLMALKSAQFSRISVPQKVFSGIDKFMTGVSSLRGSQFAYTQDRKETPTPSMTAAGLLCRMYLEWTDTKGGLRAGIRYLDELGPDPNAMYYNYYATQVMHHWGGPEWDRWNKVMREHLIGTQIRDGHAAGSWDVADRHGHIGGRVYMTTLAILTLEVYYRHLPLYQKDRIEIPLINPANDAKVP